jgi:hypothetical protein
MHKCRPSLSNRAQIHKTHTTIIVRYKLAMSKNNYKIVPSQFTKVVVDDREIILRY